MSTRYPTNVGSYGRSDAAISSNSTQPQDSSAMKLFNLTETENRAVAASQLATRMGADSATAAALYNVISPKKKPKKQ